MGSRFRSTTVVAGRRLLPYAADQRSPTFRCCIERKARVLQLLAMLFHAHAFRAFRGDRVVAGVTLSPRQLECLEWAA